MAGEKLHFLDDLRDGAATLFPARVRDYAEGAAHVAALHDGDEGRGVACLWQVVADGVLGILFLCDVANGFTSHRKSGIVHARLHAAFQNFIHILENLVIFLSSDNDIQMRDAVEKLLPARLRHAAHEAINDMRALPPLLAENAHFPKRLLLRLIPYGAGVDQDRVRIEFGRRERVAAFGEHARHLLGVALIHLAAVGFEINSGHFPRRLTPRLGVRQIRFFRQASGSRQPPAC